MIDIPQFYNATHREPENTGVRIVNILKHKKTKPTSLKSTRASN